MGPQTGLSQLMPFDTWSTSLTSKLRIFPEKSQAIFGDGGVPCVHINAKLACYGAAPEAMNLRELMERKPWTVANSLPPPERSLQLPRLHRPLRKRAKSPCTRRNTRRLRKPLPIASRLATIASGMPGMYAMKDTSMAGCADAAYQVVVACGAQQALAAVNSPHVGAVAKGVEQICKACQRKEKLSGRKVGVRGGMREGCLSVRADDRNSFSPLVRSRAVQRSGVA